MPHYEYFCPIQEINVDTMFAQEKFPFRAKIPFAVVFCLVTDVIDGFGRLR